MTQLFRWGGALTFFVSLLSMPAMYMFRLGQPSLDDRTATRDALLNVMLFTIFAMHHSVMARTGAKRWITRRIPADLERSVYVWVASLLFLAVCTLWRPLPGVVWQAHESAWLFFIPQAVGVALTLAAARIVGIWELAGVRQPDLTKPVDFRVAGPFAIVRHPIYFGWVLMVFPTPVMTSSRLLFAAISTLYLIVAIPLEERLLVEMFGDAYRTYQRQMRWRLIPYVW